MLVNDLKLLFLSRTILWAPSPNHKLSGQVPAGSKPPTCDRYLISKQNASDSTSLVKQHRAKLLRCCRISCLNNITALWLAIEPSFIRLHAKQARKHASTHARRQASKQASTQASKQGRKEASGHGFFCPVWVLIPPCHTCCFFKTLCRVLFPPCAGIFSMFAPCHTWSF